MPRHYRPRFAGSSFYEPSPRHNPSALTAADERLIAQFVAGTNHEMEHTDKWYEAAGTALDHLREDRRYYTKMKKVFPAEGRRDAAAVKKVGHGLRFNPAEKGTTKCRCGDILDCKRCKATGYCGPYGDTCEWCEGSGQREAYCRMHEDPESPDYQGDD